MEAARQALPNLGRTFRGRLFEPQTYVRPRLVRSLLGSLIGLLVALVLPAAAMAIDEFPVPTPTSQPTGITVGPDGALWFCEENGNKIARLHPSNPSVITEYPIPTGSTTPQELVTGPDGALWFTEFGANPPKIGRIVPALTQPGTSNGFTEYQLPSASSPDGITVGADNALWFTEAGTARIGRITTDNPPVISHVDLPTGSGPADITSGPDGRLWFTEISVNKIGSITTTGGSASLIERDIPTAGSDPSGITSSAGAIWFTETLGNRIGRSSTSGDITEFGPTGGGASAIAFGPDSALWFTETDANKIGRMTTGGSFTEFTVPTPGSGPDGITAGPDGALWFTEYFGNKIGRIQAGSGAVLPPPPPPPPPPVTQTAKPSVLSLGVSPSAFKAAPKGSSISAKAGATVSYRLSAAATTRFTVESEGAGRKKGKKCLKQTRRNRKAKRCKLYKPVKGSFTHSGKAGSNSFRFTGRIGNKALRPGRYQLVAVASAGSAKSTAKRASFRIVRR
jgi:virginiamycin B lyase